MADRSQTQSVLDSDLAEWLDGDSDDTREMIVEAKVPARTVRFPIGSSGHPLPKEITTNGDGDRAAVLRQLHEDLDRLLGGATNLIRAAGSIAVRANREQLLQMVQHPLVKAVRSNRRLKPGTLP
jgi:hypothetical protein